ncbi:MAG: zinc ribbon domain-containing protein, partial [Lachnospiraceae bacterium]|nr:zinc ribbon domain-containing protein [Lachnospiraceae bacterium]
MFCPNCGKQISDNSKFCGYCGAVITPPAMPVAEQPVTEPVAAPVEAAPVTEQPVTEPIA